MELRNSYLHCASFTTMNEHSNVANETIQPATPHHAADKKQIISNLNSSKRKIDQKMVNLRNGFKN